MDINREEDDVLEACLIKELAIKLSHTIFDFFSSKGESMGSHKNSAVICAALTTALGAHISGMCVVGDLKTSKEEFIENMTNTLKKDLKEKLESMVPDALTFKEKIVNPLVEKLKEVKQNGQSNNRLHKEDTL